MLKTKNEHTFQKQRHILNYADSLVFSKSHIQINFHVWFLFITKILVNKRSQKILKRFRKRYPMFTFSVFFPIRLIAVYPKH